MTINKVKSTAIRPQLATLLLVAIVILSAGIALYFSICAMAIAKLAEGIAFNLELERPFKRDF